MLSGALGAAAPWPLGLATTVVACLLMWPVGARLRLAPSSRLAATALFAAAALVVDGSTADGADGRSAVLLAAAAALAVHGRWRAALAAVACVAAAVVTPAVGVGFLVLLAGLTLQGGLLRRWRRGWRAGAAAAAVVAAAGVMVWTSDPSGPPGPPPGVLAGLAAWALLAAGLLWRRQPWLRPVGAAALAVLGCAWVPGAGSGPAIVLAGVIALQTVVLVEEHGRLLARRSAAAVAVTVVALAALLGPGHVAVPAAPVGTDPQVTAMAVRVEPVSIAIPTLGVSGPLEHLTADPVTGELAAPADPQVAGWFAAGVVPGETGPAVVGGHVDSRSGPGVFFRLRSLAPGDLVVIRRSDGRAVRFTVTDVHRYPKDRFPSAAVYGPTPTPELRLVTCGGVFDRAERSYRDNVVVDAILAPDGLNG